MSLSSIIKKIIELFKPEFKVNADDSFKLSFFSNSKFIDIKQETINNVYNVNIDLNKATPEQQEKLMELYPEIKEQNSLILKGNNYSDLKKYLGELKDTPLLKYFQNKLSEHDYRALRTAVFIKNKFDSGEDVSAYLEELYIKFGIRGRNINNLYGEAYFEDFIKPLYAILESENRTQEFAEQFDKFVIEQPISYFVHQRKTQEQVNKDLLNKIDKNKKYGIKRLNIHGINKINIKKVENFIKEIENREDVKILSLIKKDNRISLSLEIT